MKLANLLLGLTVVAVSLGSNLSPVKAEHFSENDRHFANFANVYARKPIRYKKVCRFKKVFVRAHYVHGKYVPARYVTKRVCFRVRH